MRRAAAVLGALVYAGVACNVTTDPWVVDPTLPPGHYTLEGRMVVSPDLRPAFVFQVR